MQEILVRPDAKPRHSYRVAQRTGPLSLTENRLSEPGHTHTLTAQQKSPQMSKKSNQPRFSQPVRLHAFSLLPKKEKRKK